MPSPGVCASTLTERVNEQHRAGIAILDAALGADRCQALQTQGAAMDEHDVIVLARTAVSRELNRLDDDQPRHADALEER